MHHLFMERQVEAITDLDTRLNDLATRLNDLATQLPVGKPDTTIPQGAMERVLITEETAQSSDATARLVKAKPDGQQMIIKGKEGYICIGNYNSNLQKWENQKLLRLDSSQPVETPPEAISAGGKYKVAGNMVIRRGLPKNDKEYFRGQPCIGIVPRGTLVEILEKPVGIDREFAVQYWIRIKVSE
jgi:hypothetical protein